MPRRAQPRTVAAPPDIRDDRWQDRLFFAGFYVAAFAVLGIVVSSHPPYAFDASTRFLAGGGTAVAELLRRAGTFPVYATVSAALLVAGLVKREWLRAVVVAILTLLAAWQTSDLVKDIFRRPRPSYWYVHKETSFAYPSGHATLVVAFYGFLTAIVWSSALPLATRRWVRLAFVAFALAIGWSRLALGAHYVTDLIGGYLLGAGFASLGLLVYRLLEPPEKALG